MKIKYVKWGLANRFSDVIELNENLKHYPNLHKPILEHELSHSNQTFSTHDLKHDLSLNPGLNHWELMKFMFRYPRSLIQLAPFYWSKERKKLIYDLNLMFVYSISFGVFLLASVLSYSFL